MTAKSSKTSENVKVTVRSRPLKPNEQSNDWSILQQEARIIANKGNGTTNEFNFDHLFNGSDNEALYNASIKDLITQTMEGYNATVFAYGQTASGKTYTMMGSQDEPGIIPRSVNDIFDHIEKSTDREFLLRVSYLEIYNESIRDLLNPTNQNLKIHEDKRRGVYVSLLTEEVVASIDQVFDIINRGEVNRHISSTDYNLHSSRSHTIFQIIIESREKTSSVINLNTKRTFTSSNDGNMNSAVKISKLNLIDLAGSEKAVSNESRRKEGSYINKSLLTLGTVISKLTDSKSNVHVPFRDSKLTRILQTSLTGLAKVSVICTISPSIKSIDESINTLKFASRVKKITVHAKNDAMLDDKALIHKYRGEIMELKSKLQSALTNQQSQSLLAAERQEYEQKLSQMRNVRCALKDRIDHLTRLILTSSSSTTVDKETFVEKTASLNDDHVNTMKEQLEAYKNASHEKDLKLNLLESKLAEKNQIIARLQAELSIKKAEMEVAYDTNKHAILYQESAHVSKLIPF